MKVFKKVEKQLPQLTTLDLQYVSPELLKARNLELAVPGTCHEQNELFRLFILDYRDISERKGNHYDYKLCLQAFNHHIEAATPTPLSQRQ
jgi:hypothetical protein